MSNQAHNAEIGPPVRCGCSDAGFGYHACAQNLGTRVTPPVYGMCTACGSVEVALVKKTGTRDLSDIGESAHYPTGYGCEACS